MGNEVEELLPKEEKWPVVRKRLSIIAAIAFASCGAFALTSLVFLSLRPSYFAIANQPNATEHRDQFFIVSEMNEKVVAIKKGNPDVGAEIVMKSKNLKNPKRQLWYLDRGGYIHSALNDLVITAKFNGTAHLAPFSKDPDSHWKFQDKLIVNEAGEVLDIRFRNRTEGASLTAFKYHGTKNEQWRKETFKQRQR